METDSIKSASIRVDVRCKLTDDTEIPSGYCVSVGEPDENGYVEYALSGRINADQLRQLYAILKGFRHADKMSALQSRRDD